MLVNDGVGWIVGAGDMMTGAGVRYLPPCHPTTITAKPPTTTPNHVGRPLFLTNPGPVAAWQVAAWHVIEPARARGGVVHGLRMVKDGRAGAFWASNRSTILPPKIKENSPPAHRRFWGDWMFGGEWGKNPPQRTT